MTAERILGTGLTLYYGYSMHSLFKMRQVTNNSSAKNLEDVHQGKDRKFNGYKPVLTSSMSIGFKPEFEWQPAENFKSNLRR